MPNEMTDTIILHPNDDGTYHWMCPNCKREDLGLSAETDLTAYCPNVTCPNCGFQFGVDKRYLNEVSASYICGECLLTQRFNGTCGNCGANALRRVSIPVPLAIPNTDKELTVEEIAEIETLRKRNTGPSFGYAHELCTAIDSLIATVKQLRAERLEVQRALASSVLNDPTEDDDPPYTTTELVNGISNLIRRKESLLARLVAQRSSNKDLQSQLEQLRAENEQLKLIVDVGTNDDPGTALAKLRKIQHVAATSMRDKCVENLGSLVEGYKNDLFATDDEDYKASLGFAVDALDKAIRSISSLTLEPLEPEKQKL